MTRGKLILIEGLDRTGKSTQSEKIVKELGDEVVLFKFPERSTPIGGLINQYLTDRSFDLPPQSIHLLFSANRWEVNAKIRSLLESGKHVVLDRYVYSGVAYSAAKQVPGMDISWCLNPDKGLVKPDLTLFLSNQDSSSLQDRDGYGEERYEKAAFQKKVRETFFQVFDAIPDDNRVIVDVTGKSIEQVFDTVMPLVRKVLGNNSEDYLYF